MHADDAQAALAAKHDDGRVLRRLASLSQRAGTLVGRGLPAPVHSLLTEAFTAPSYQRSSMVARHRGIMGAHFAEFDTADWRAAVETLLPQHASSANAALEALARRPFQDALTRRSFRAPRSPQTLADVRGRWLCNTTILLGEYDADARWIAEHGAHLATWWGATDLGWFLAGAIDADDAHAATVFETLAATVRGEQGSAPMGRHVTQALMSCARPDAWELVERLLLSAQRQEGLRQAVLESIDEAHPQAFRRMVRLILEHDLTRFSSVVRAADTWFGFAWDGASAVKTASMLECVLTCLDDPAARTAALAGDDAERAYLALWSIAFDDVDAAIPPAIALLHATEPERRFVGVHFLVQSLWSTAMPPLVEALADADLRVAARALDSFLVDMTSHVDGTRLFEQLEGLLGRLTTRSQTLDAIVWPWWTRKLERPFVASALAANAGQVTSARLVPYVADLDPFARAAFLRDAAGVRARWETRPRDTERRDMTAAERGVAIDLLGDPSADVRTVAFEVMRELPLESDEVDRLVALLARKPGDLRSGALTRLRTLPDDALLAVADRLLGDAGEPRRLAGLELLRDAHEARRMPDAVRARLQQYADARVSLSDPERVHLDVVLGPRTTVLDTRRDGAAHVTTSPATRDDALGLLSAVAPRDWPAPVAHDVVLDTHAVRESLTSLALLVLAHQGTEVRTAAGETRLLPEADGWSPALHRREALDAQAAELPLAEVWRCWFRDRPESLCDADGLEFLRMLLHDAHDALWTTGPVQQVCGLGPWSAGTHLLRALCEWCLIWQPPPSGAAFLLDGFETALAQLDPSDYAELRTNGTSTRVWYDTDQTAPGPEQKVHRAETWLRRLRWWRRLHPAAVTAPQATRLFALLRAFEERSEGFAMLHITIDDFLGAYRAGAVGDEELTHLLVGRWSYRTQATLLRELSTRRPPAALVEYPALLAVVDRCRRRVIEVEVQRGDRESAASGLAMELRFTGGLETVMRSVPALGRSYFTRSFGWSASGASRQDTLSHLVLRSVPRAEDTLDAFAHWALEARVGEARLIELAVYAPQWSAHVNNVLQWPGFEDGVWWIQAHTKDDRSWQLSELKELWTAEVSERTPLSTVDLTEGAVDVAWFTRVYRALGAARWKALDTAAKYAASAAGHTRAQLFARAMVGAVTRNALLERIDTSRHQDSVRALGLLPLAEGEARDADLLDRYQRLERFRREARQFGAQRQQSESRAVAIALANLARTAGYSDPQRLQWAMEREAVADLAVGPVVLVRGEVQVSLSIDADGDPTLVCTKSGKLLKAIPATLRRDTEAEALKARLQELRRQQSRVRDALEAAMCRGDAFDRDELGVMLAHPMLAPPLQRLVFVGDGVAGYLAEGGRVLRDHRGAQHVVGTSESLRIAHPHDLLARGDWSAWQRECFIAERIQPFKQLFRELYPITASERGTDGTRRYAGHQVNPRQALTLLGTRGWVARPEEGVCRTFHDAGITVRLDFQETFYTPADVEGLTLEVVRFTKKGDWTPLPLETLNARLFSEAMRDLDLVVSVAHQGGVDPEATASTTEMRATLLQESCALLGITNVSVTGTHAHIRGTLGDYAVHLGSANVMLMPGTALPIVAVHAQHRGRLFLPFADDDPKTAEVLSKVLLLARDRELRDLGILERIRAAQAGGG